MGDKEVPKEEENWKEEFGFEDMEEEED